MSTKALRMSLQLNILLMITSSSCCEDKDLFQILLPYMLIAKSTSNTHFTLYHRPMKNHIIGQENHKSSLARARKCMWGLSGQVY